MVSRAASFDATRENFLERYRPKLVVAVLLTFASGLVDIVGYLGIYHFFTAHLTGTTVQLGQSLAERQWLRAFATLIILGAFFGGSLLGRALIEVASRSRVKRIATVTLILEAALLAIVILRWPGFTEEAYWGLALLAGAMGIQTATLTGVGPLTVHTTFVTGMVNKLAQMTAHISFRAYDLGRSKAKDARMAREQKLEIEFTAFLFVIWMFYVSGAAVGTLLFEDWKLRVLLIALGMIAVGIVTDQIWPLAIEEEKEQSER
jgi:uncharacterized membrane protein YoaK (UPF0700 family)